MRLIDADEVVKFYNNMGKKFPGLSVGVHFSIADIISNLENIPTVKEQKRLLMRGITTMTMTNAEWMIKNGYKFSNLFVRRLNNEERNKFVVCYNNEKIDYFELNECHISFNDSAYKKWLDMEHKEPILDDAEKRYLSAVIKPFRDDFYAITKKTACSDGAREYIVISVHGSTIIFPDFNKNTMYKGMELGKRYTLEELGL